MPSSQPHPDSSHVDRCVRARLAVCVIDPGSHFNESWNTRFHALEITNLRSPAFAHPMAFEPSALVNFAIREGRTDELTISTESGSTSQVRSSRAQALEYQYET